jgi:glyoxylase-like metal-dependent hydrolase (beta-lactamase superfamily II)
MPGLLPSDFFTRATLLSNEQLQEIRTGLPEFERGWDLAGDGTLIAVPLPGHAIGQMGLIVKLEHVTVFLVADACWNSKSYRELLFPHPLARLVIADNRAFDDTLRRLHRLHIKRPDVLIVPTHCQEALCLRF